MVSGPSTTGKYSFIGEVLHHGTHDLPCFLVYFLSIPKWIYVSKILSQAVMLSDERCMEGPQRRINIGAVIT